MTTTKSASRKKQSDSSSPEWPEWKQWVEKRLPLYGHRNWLVIADSAYPAQSKEGIETIAVDHSQELVISQVLATLRATRHVRPIIHTDRELAFVDEKDAPGITSYREWLAGALEGLDVHSSLHEEIIAKLDWAAQTFCVTVIKTNMSIPYTTVFLELGCAYWNSHAEKRLRNIMRA